MGAFDTLTATSACPACGDLRWLDHQLKFFDPESYDQAWLHVGHGRPLHFPPAEIDRAELWDDEWLRISAKTVPGRATLLLDWGGLCSCGTQLVEVARFSLDPNEARLVALERRDADHPRVLEEVDFVRERSFDDLPPFAELVRQPRRARRRALLRALRPDPQPAPRSADPEFVGPVRCEHCGQVRHTAGSSASPRMGAFFGPSWPAGRMSPGDWMPLPELGASCVHAGFYRLREPAPGELVLMLLPGGYGCRCGAGMASPVLRLARGADALSLRELSWRSVRSHEDLRGVDWIETRFAEAYGREPDPEAVIMGLLRERARA